MISPEYSRQPATADFLNELVTGKSSVVIYLYGKVGCSRLSAVAVRPAILSKGRTMTLDDACSGISALRALAHGDD
jgi:hypothetical protein